MNQIIALKEISLKRVESLSQRQMTLKYELSEMETEIQHIHSQYQEEVSTRKSRINDVAKNADWSIGSSYVQLKVNASSQLIDGQIAMLESRRSTLEEMLKHKKEKIAVIKKELKTAIRRQQKWLEIEGLDHRKKQILQNNKTQYFDNETLDENIIKSNFIIE